MLLNKRSRVGLGDLTAISLGDSGTWPENRGNCHQSLLNSFILSAMDGVFPSSIPTLWDYSLGEAGLFRFIALRVYAIGNNTLRTEIRFHLLGNFEQAAQFLIITRISRYCSDILRPIKRVDLDLSFFD